MNKPPLPERLSIITTTHLLASAPSTAILGRTIDVLRRRLPVEGCRHLLYYDQPSGLGDLEAKYLANLQRLADRHGLELYVRPGSGLKANLLEGLQAVTTPYVLFLEHDWLFSRPVRLETLLDVFDRYDHVNIVRFNKNRNDSHIGWDHFSLEDERVRELPLTMTSAWSNNPHVVRVSKWRDDWAARLGPQRHQRADGVEEVLYFAYNRDIFTKGFRESNAEWGSYLYGPYHAPPLVYHSNGALHRGRWLAEYPFKAWRLARRLIRGHGEARRLDRDPKPREEGARA